MKQWIQLLAFTGLLAFANPARAQDSKAEQIGKDIKKGAKKAGNKTAELASKGKAKVTDAPYKGKMGPDGQTVYIDNHSRYYWIDDTGKRHYITEAQLREKPRD